MSSEYDRKATVQKKDVDQLSVTLTCKIRQIHSLRLTENHTLSSSVITTRQRPESLLPCRVLYCNPNRNQTKFR